MLSEKIFSDFMAKNCQSGECLTEMSETVPLLSAWYDRFIPPAVSRTFDNVGDFFVNASNVGSELPNTVYQPIIGGAAQGIGGFLQNPDNISGLVNAGIASQTGGIGGLGGLFGNLTGQNQQGGNQNQNFLGGIDPLLLIGGGVLVFFILNRK